jgi:DNA end-binding protein Ku
MAGIRAGWRGAIEFEGFVVNVALYSRVKKQRNESFRLIGPSGQPIQSNYPLDSGTGKEIKPEEVRRSVEVGSGKAKKYVPMTEEAIERINSGIKTEIAQADRYAPLESIDLALAIDRFVVRADDKVPGAAANVNVLWNGLRASGLAHVSQISPGGGHDAILVLYADEHDFRGVLLPFEAELYPVPPPEFERNDKAGELFRRVIDEEMVKPFDHAAYVSEYRARRQEAIDAVIAGADIKVEAPPEPVSQVPDLMAALQASVEALKDKPKPKAKRTRAKKTEAV